MITSSAVVLENPLGDGRIFCVIMVRRGGNLSKNNGKNQLWIGLALVLVAVVLIVVVVINAMKGEATGDMKIGGEAKVTGMVCKSASSLHPALTSVEVDSYTNTITANFSDDKLSSISLLYEGEYKTAKNAESAETYARSDYNEILIKKYGEDIEIFSSNFSVDGTKMQFVQTTHDIGKINEKTVAYFLLDQGTHIAKSLDGLKKQYEAKGFSCEISD